MSGAGDRRVSLLVVAAVVPVEVAGTSIVVRRLLENFAPEEVVLVGRPPNRRASLNAGRMHYPVIELHAPHAGHRGERFWRLASAVPGFLQGWAAIRRYKPAAILAMFPDECSLLTGYLLHRATKLPLVTYFCDLYAEDRRPGTWEARMARWLQGRVFSAARRVFAINEAVVGFYRDRYDLPSVCLPMCINQPIPDDAPPPEPGRPFRIGYSGNVNEARVGSLQALIEAVGGDPRYALDYFTPQSPAHLESLGVWAKNARARFVSDEAALIPQLAECDALFMPLTFERDALSQDQLATCFGVKSYEYFQARRPIVVHAPGEYFLARFYRDKGCGVVVDVPDPEALRTAFERIRADGSLRRAVVSQGLAVARTCEGPRVAAILRRELSALARGGSKAAP